MEIAMFNSWYFFWLLLSAGGVVALYYGLRNKSTKTQKIVLWSLLAFGLLLHFLKATFPPYSVDEARKWRDAWFVNICGANIALFPFLFFSKKKSVKDYMFYIGVISGLIALFYPQEPLAKSNQLGETLDIIRFYYHHWMLLAVPLLMVLFKQHTLSYKRIIVAPTGLILLALFIILNQIFQSELGYIPLRDDDFFDINYKNSSYIWGPGTDDAIGNFLATFTPNFFKTVPVGEHAGELKYWPWFWLLVPIYILVIPLALLISLPWEYKNFVTDMKALPARVKALLARMKKAPEAEVSVDEAQDEVAISE